MRPRSRSRSTRAGFAGLERHRTRPAQHRRLFGERAGWSLPGFGATGWTPVNLPNSDPTPGVAWYHTTFNLNEPRGVDASIGLNIADAATKPYRAGIFLNGWNLGLSANDVGPRHTFVLPNGLLHTGIDDDGKNTLAIAVLSPNAGGGTTGGDLSQVSLSDARPGLGVAQGGVTVATYTASTTANVTSTAGDATLSVSDPDPAHPSHLVNGAYALPQALQANATRAAGTGNAFAPSREPRPRCSPTPARCPTTRWLARSSNRSRRTRCARAAIIIPGPSAGMK